MQPNPDGPQPALLVKGLPPRVEGIDETTIRYSCAWPNQAFLPAPSAANPVLIFPPAHYLKQFNPKYANGKVLNHLLVETKLKDWHELHRRRDDPMLLTNPDMPTLGPWISMSRPGSDRYEAERNPYYHRVDKSGE